MGAAENYVEIGPLCIRYLEKGEGAPLVLVHGGGPGASAASNFERNIDALARRFRVIAPDLPGFGGSTPARIEGGLFCFHANVLRSFMDQLDVARADFVGNSLGAGAALKLTLDSPERARRLVLMGGGSLPVLTPTPSQGMAALARYYGGEGPSIEKMREFLGVLVAGPSRIDDATISQRFALSTDPAISRDTPLRAGAPNLEPLWRMGVDQLPHPTLLIWGREDRVVPLDGAFLLLAQMANAQLHVFGNCGHWSQWEAADAFNQLVTSFLEGPN